MRGEQPDERPPERPGGGRRPRAERSRVDSPPRTRDLARQFTGTARLVRLALRRDRIQLPIWLLALTGMQAATISSIVGLYSTEAARQELAVSTATSAVAAATNGLVSGTSTGAIVTSQSLLIMLVGGALMCTLAVVRHTRQEEETGRSELIGAGVVGRYALLSAAVIVAVGTAAALGLLNAVTLLAYGLPLAGSVATGLTIAGAGAVFTGLGALAAQVTQSARAANGLAAAGVGAAFLLRAVGDATGTVTDGGVRVVSGPTSWLSPIGWAQQIRPYDRHTWVVLVPLAACALLGVAVAFALVSHRDMGAGLLAARRGPERAASSLLGPLGLAWRLQRGTLLGWAVGITVMGAAYGGIGNELDDFLGSNEQVSDLMSQLGGGTTDLTDAYFAGILGFMGIAVAAYAVQSLLRLRSEETGALEPLFATALSRTRWLYAHVVVAVLGTAALLLLLGLAMGGTYGLVVQDMSRFGDIVTASLVQLPAALVVAGLTVAIFGVLPRWSAAISWGALAAFMLLGQIGRLLDLPSAVLDLSPFSHVPAVPAVDVSIPPMLGLLTVAAALGLGGTLLFRRRDLAL